MFLFKPVSIGVYWTYPNLPDAAHCLSGHRSCCSRRNPSPWIFCTAHPGAASPDVPSLCFLWPGKQRNIRLGRWTEKKNKVTKQRKQKLMRNSKPLKVQTTGKVVCWLEDDRIHFYRVWKTKYLFFDGHSHIRFDLAEGFHQEFWFIRRRGHFLWFVDPKVMLLAKLKKAILF